MPAYKNLILSALSEGARAFLRPHLSPVTLRLRAIIEQPGEVIQTVVFPESGFISVVANNRHGGRLEAGMIGRDGMTALAVLLGDDRSANETYVQAAGAGHSMHADALRLVLSEKPEIRAVMSRYALAFLAQTTQTALANGRARIDERLARWLLMARDRMDSPDLPLTHDLVALMLGVRRPGVTDALHRLEGDGLIRARRGVITIRQREGLERVAKGSYGVAEGEYQRLMGAALAA